MTKLPSKRTVSYRKTFFWNIECKQSPFPEYQIFSRKEGKALFSLVIISNPFKSVFLS